MSDLVMEIEDYTLSANQPLAVSRRATYFLLMSGTGVDVTFSYKGSRIGGGTGLQGGDAVGPLAQPYDQVTLKSATGQTVKIATSSDPVTITRLSGTVSVAGVVETAPDYSRVRAGEAFLMGLTKTAVAGEFSYLQLWNDADSGVDLVIPAMYIRPPSGSSVLFYLGGIEATAGNLNNYATKEAESMLVQSPLTLNGNTIGRIGSSANTRQITGAVSQSMTPGEGWMDLQVPFVIEPGTGISVQSRAINVEIAMAAQIFEVAR